MNKNIWYKCEAKEWTQALPMGNGHMGAMAYGGAEGRFDLSENTCWSGGEQDQTLDKDAKEHMKQARLMLVQNRVEEAEELLKKCLGIKGNFGTQVPLGRLFVRIDEDAECTYRGLDLESGVCLDKLLHKGTELQRESFISNPHKVMGVKVSANGKALPQLSLWVEGWSQPSMTNWKDKDLKVKGKALEIKHSDGLNGVDYAIQVRIITDGTFSWSRKGLLVNGATSVIVYMASATNMFIDQIEASCEKWIDQAEKLGWVQLKAEHITDHAGWMNKCILNLPENEASGLPTDLRIRKYGDDPSDEDLVSLFFQYGRYLLLNSSREDSLLPAALQGVWNDDRACRMGWTDDFHLDINTQMNYFPAEVTGLSESTAPLFRWIKEILKPNGEKIAQELYGGEGWVAHTVSNAFGWASPGWSVVWGFHVSGGAWMATHIWDHYSYTKDKLFLREHFDVLYGAGQFLHSLLMENPQTGEMVTNPSYSPENAYLLNGKKHNITTGATADTLLTKVIFQALIDGAAILDCEDEFISGLKETLSKLPPFKVGKYGQLQEWNEDFEEAFLDHRHTSHLLSLYPFHLIKPEKSPELAAGVRKTLERRLQDAKDIILANWAGALLILYHARLFDGELAGQFVKPMIAFLSRDNMMITHEGPTTSISGGIYELDGNTGFTAGVAEMLLQSSDGEIHVLPAIPSRWQESEGSYKGLVARGGHKVDVFWNAQEVSITIYAKSDSTLKVRYKDEETSISVLDNQKYSIIFDVL